ncbi:MAG: hypothetical protein IPG63_17730 [Xanthomonadales bacterium]|nr:hypothetical protein [Xanthomonadales bacterium]
MIGSYGNDGNDTLLAGDGVDYVYGGDGDDLITGGHGNDLLSGGTGSNVYRFGRGDGVDEITLESNTDVLRLDAGIDANQLIMARSGDDLLIEIIGTTDQVRVLDHFVVGAGPAAIEFAGGGAALTAASTLRSPKEAVARIRRRHQRQRHLYRGPSRRPDQRAAGCSRPTSST